MKLVALFLTIVPLNPGGPVEAGPPERRMAVKKRNWRQIAQEAKQDFIEELKEIHEDNQYAEEIIKRIKFSLRDWELS
ncbi:hypothetical protein [uncultured Desulfobacter sp.]|uniref:hypothetical protein n=1 Tax=uncultured Desulfobacter sp. TaxID=240139 RepID=UPI0029F51F44|nr:hypothetical protein [uncultured Desulfobacter sp.]